MTQNDIDIGRILTALWSRVRLIAGIFVAAVTIAAVTTWLTPNTYTASATLNFEFSANPVDTRSRVLSEDTYLTTQIGIIESLNVANEVESRLSEYERERLIMALDARHSVMSNLMYDIRSSIKSLFSSSKREEPHLEGDYEGETLEISSAYNWLVKSIGSGLSVEPGYKSRIVAISYTSTDPRIAALMANRYADGYITTSVRMITDPAQKSKVWFEAQLKSLRTRLEDTQGRLTAYQQEEGIVSSDDRLNLETKQLQDIANQLASARQTTRNAVTEQQKLKEVVDRGAPLTTFHSVSENPVVQKIKAEIRDLRGQLVQRSSSLGKNHPEIKKLNSEIYSARIRLDSEINAIVDGINNAVELSKERELNLENALTAQKLTVLGLKNEHDKIAVLLREVESAQATYNAALNQMNTTSMQSMVDQTNVTIVDGANIPRTHSSPRVMLNLALGAFGGLLLGIGIALLLEMTTRRVYSPAELVAELEIPLLGHLKNI